MKPLDRSFTGAAKTARFYDTFAERKTTNDHVGETSKESSENKQRGDKWPEEWKIFRQNRVSEK